MADVEVEVERVIVVGMNRTRLLKIMAMVADEALDDESSLNVEYIPCVVAMSSYEGEDGESIRYMSSFVFHDGSPMTKFFNDEAFRLSLSTVIMVGYEWKESDEELVGKYFEANLLSISIECIHPNPDFFSLNEEMDHFRNLTDEEKAQHSSNHTMGPRKMKRFILDTAKSLKSISSKEDAIEVTETKQEETTDVDGGKEKTGKGEESAPKEEQEQQKRIPGFIDHDLTTFACRMCRTILLGENNFADEHIQNQHSFKRRSHKFAPYGASCQSLFCEESVLEWLAPEGENVEGKLTCSKCSVKIGHWNWSGAQCSCGTWVVPAIQIPLGKVDVILSPSERIKASPILVVAPTES